MRFEGTLTKWNEERGFGFITPIPAGQNIFVHVSAFARDGKRPQLQEVLSFEITMNKDGKKQAVAVRRDRPAPSATVARDWRRTDTSDEPRALSSRIVVFVIACALLAAAYWQYDRRSQRAMAFKAEAAAQALDVALPGLRGVACHVPHHDVPDHARFLTTPLPGSARSRTPAGRCRWAARPSRTPATGERQTPHRSRGSRCGRERHE